MMLSREMLALKLMIERFEVIDMKQSDALCAHDVFILVEWFVIRKWKHEFREFLVVAFLHQDVANAGDLIRSKNERLRTFAGVVWCWNWIKLQKTVYANNIQARIPVSEYWLYPDL